MANEPSQLPVALVASPAPLLLVAVVAMALIGVVSVIVVAVFVPDQAAVLITTIVAMLLPTTAALLALLKGQQNEHAIQSVHVALDGRLTQLLETVGKEQHAAGRIEGIASVGGMPEGQS